MNVYPTSTLYKCKWIFGSLIIKSLICLMFQRILINWNGSINTNKMCLQVLTCILLLLSLITLNTLMMQFLFICTKYTDFCLNSQIWKDMNVGLKQVVKHAHVLHASFYYTYIHKHKRVLLNSCYCTWTIFVIFVVLSFIKLWL